MGRVLTDYAIAIGWGVVGAISMAAGLAILLKVFDWLTPINEWAEIQKGNLSVAIIMAAVILALGIAVGAGPQPCIFLAARQLHGVRGTRAPGETGGSTYSLRGRYADHSRVRFLFSEI